MNPITKLNRSSAVCVEVNVDVPLKLFAVIPRRLESTSPTPTPTAAPTIAIATIKTAVDHKELGCH